MSAYFTSEEVLAVSEEIVSLTRAGVPLESNLTSFGDDLSGQTAQLMRELGGDLQQGRQLVEAIRRRPEFPPIFRAILEAGVASGRLPSALEKLSQAIRTANDLRRHLRISLFYPAIVVTIAYICFLVSLVYVFPVFESHRVDLTFDQGPPSLAAQLRWTMAYWAWIPPLIGVALFGWIWWRGRFDWLGGAMSRMTRSTYMAMFAELLAVLVEHDEPLDRAVILAAETTGNSRLLAEAQQIADDLRAGGSPQTNVGPKPAIPPMMRWVLCDRDNPTRMLASLQRASHSYRQRAEGLHQWCRHYLPLILTAALGGAATLLYGLSIVIPWSQTIYDLIRYAPTSI